MELKAKEVLNIISELKEAQLLVLIRIFIFQAVLHGMIGIYHLRNIYVQIRICL